MLTFRVLMFVVAPVTVKVRIFQDLLTHLFLQHRSFTDVLPALTNVVRIILYTQQISEILIGQRTNA